LIEKRMILPMKKLELPYTNYNLETTY